MSEYSMTREMLSAVIADRCAEDRAFMKRLLQAPRATIEQAGGFRLPSHLRLHLHRNDADHWHVPLACHRKRVTSALADLDLGSLNASGGMPHEIDVIGALFKG